MDFLERDDSQVAAFFANRTVLITGGTGFIGKLLIEKLLRSCPAIGQIFVIIREKRGASVQQRLNSILSEQIFEGLLSRRPEARSRVSALAGDIEKRFLGLSDKDLRRVQSEVEIVIHSAATVKFNEPLVAAVRVNVGATANMVELCRNLQKLCSFVHVSTAYVNVNQPSEPRIKECIYPFDLRADDLLELTARLPPAAMEAATPHLLGAYPNTYTFTKRLAEELVFESGLPAAIVRPSVVVATAKEPFPGWIDNINGPTGFFLALGTGSLTAVYANSNTKVDLIPADLVVNCIIVAAFKRATTKTDRRNRSVPIIHSCLGRVMSLSGQEMQLCSYRIVATHPLIYCIRFPHTVVCSNLWEFRLRMLLFHRLPMEIADFLLCRVAGKQLPLRKLYARMTAGLDALSFFFHQDWDFMTSSAMEMQESLGDTDRYLFPIVASDDFKWDYFLKVYLFSIKYFILHEDLTTTAAALAWRKKIVVRDVVTPVSSAHGSSVAAPASFILKILN
ncbi:putative fatty acyl-CoA reductase CG5065 isoform X2 [Varroa destructor]|uniref:Fatty acyl-CoA reductase n=1 Tax=Varroa destructor TaxID=109461 RepID=A0A7M7J4L6_VARDE|nr:putative fatty acyl-CoA reductase CG5065 isoform X2 [Varroa destructor]XP_022646778.1 putative fatty acyl-CoA reductase CG5065 isoform X2 [Varroa destructor]XP_022646779.1 putative fatty acyl-CoA reductase CG5065 isoform X2 [Varroa destructor]